MNKELSPLEALYDLTQLAFYYVENNGCLENAKKYKDIIETALNEREELIDTLNAFNEVLNQPFETVKKLKALEIIKEKRVNVGDFVRCKTIEDYNNYLCYEEKEQLTQEEYDLLKQVLGE